MFPAEDTGWGGEGGGCGETGRGRGVVGGLLVELGRAASRGAGEMRGAVDVDGNDRALRLLLLHEHYKHHPDAC